MSSDEVYEKIKEIMSSQSSDKEADLNLLFDQIEEEESDKENQLKES